jgi:hypothetical protein
MADGIHRRYSRGEHDKNGQSLKSDACAGRPLKMERTGVNPANLRDRVPQKSVMKRSASVR